MGTVSFGQTGARGARSSGGPGLAIFALVGAVLVALGAAALMKVPWQDAFSHLAARAWPAAEAMVLSVSLTEERRAATDGSGVASELVLRVAYRFEAGGGSFTGSLDDRADPYDRRLRTLYRKLHFAALTGRAMPVRYDPRDPSRAVLDTGFAWRPALLHGGLGLAGALLGLRLLLAPLRRRGGSGVAAQ